MKLSVFPSLTAEKERSIRALEADCRAASGSSLSFPFTDAALFLTASSQNRLLAAMAFVPDGPDGFECAAMTRPDVRRQGLFSALLERGLSELPGDPELYFYTDGRCADTEKTILALGAELLSTEYQMELSSAAPHGSAGSGDSVSPADSENSAAPACSLPLSITAVPPAAAAGPSLPQPPASKTSPKGTGLPAELLYTSPAGRIRIALRQRGCYLYGFEISEELRGQGFGRQLLSAVLADVNARGLFPVSLQVSGSNAPALALYQKTGFRITETLFCYLY